MVVAKIRAVYKRKENTALASPDATNSYNSIVKQLILGELCKRESLRYFWGVTNLTLGKTGHLELY